MTTKLEIKREDTMTSLKDYQRESYKEINTKNIIPKINDPIIVDPIDPKRVSMDRKSINGKSVAKAIAVFLFTLGGYFLVKKTDLLSYFKGTNKKSNPNMDSNEITKVKNAITTRKTLGTIGQTNNPIVNSVTQTNKDEDRTIKFEEEKVKELKDFQNKKNTNVRRSISCPKQYLTIQTLFKQHLFW
jgi:hypothetical protein